jgi:hypothetical protein
LASQLQDIFPDHFSQGSHGRQQRIGFFNGKKSRERGRGNHTIYFVARGRNTAHQG